MVPHGESRTTRRETTVKRVVRLAFVAVLVLFSPSSAWAGGSQDEAATAAQKKDELLRTQIMYASGGAGLLGAIGLACWVLSAANGKHKKATLRERKIAMGLNPDAPRLEP
jgi:hypothetical protein